MKHQTKDICITLFGMALLGSFALLVTFLFWTTTQPSFKKKDRIVIGYISCSTEGVICNEK